MISPKRRGKPISISTCNATEAAAAFDLARDVIAKHAANLPVIGDAGAQLIYRGEPNLAWIQIKGGAWTKLIGLWARGWTPFRPIRLDAEAGHSTLATIGAALAEANHAVGGIAGKRDFFKLLAAHNAALKASVLVADALVAIDTLHAIIEAGDPHGCAWSMPPKNACAVAMAADFRAGFDLMDVPQ